MAAESNVGARLLLIGKDGVLAGIREITGATAQMNAEIAAGGRASKVAAAGYAEQGAGLEALQAKMAMYEKQLGTVNAETDALARVGKIAFFSLAAAGAAWTYESIKWAQNYQTELVRLRTQAGLTVSAMNQIGAAAMRNSAALGTTPTAYLQAAYHPASTGMSTQQVISITNYAAMASAISGAPLEDTTNAITGVMKAYGYKGSGEHTTALLNAVVGAGNMRFADLNAALGSGIASVAKTYGVSPTSWGGALARLTDVGTPPAMAGTHLRMALALLGAPTSESAKLLTAAGMGTSQATAASGAMASALVAAGLNTTQVSAALRNNSGAGGIYNALELLHKGLSAGGLSPALQGDTISRAFGGGKMGTAILQLYSNLPALQRKSGQIEGNATNKRFMSDWAQTTQTLNFQLHRLGGELETVGTAFGKDVLPYVTDAVKVFTDLLTVMGHNKALVIGLGTAITAILVPAIGVYLYRALLGQGSAIRAVLNAYMRLIGGQTAEQVALSRTDAALATNDVALRTNTGALTSDDAAALGRTGGAGRLGTLGKVAAGVGVAAAGVTAYQLTTSYLNSTKQKGLGHDVIGAGVDVANWLGLGPKQVAQQQTHSLLGPATVSWLQEIASGEIHDKSMSAAGAGSELSLGGFSVHPLSQAHVHVYIDGKDVTRATVKHVKSTAARK